MVRPILFNGEMVQAILEGRKTVTRRIIKPHYRDDESGFQVVTSKSGEFIRVEKVDEDECGIFADGTERYVNPPFQTGDILYVRETWTEECPYGIDSCQIGKNCKTGTLCDICKHNKPYYYRADGIDDGYVKWNPSIHMPKAAARIWLKVTDVRAERLKNITTDQILKEGANPGKINNYRDQISDGTEEWDKAAYLFVWSQIWDDTVHKKDLPTYGWDANPWVWVIEFERCEKPEEAEG